MEDDISVEVARAEYVSGQGGKESVMINYLKDIRHIISFMAFLVVLLVGISFVTVSNAAVVPAANDQAVGNPAVMPAVVPPVGVKAVNVVVNPFDNPAFIRPALNPNIIRPAINSSSRSTFNPFFPFFDADLDDVGFFGVGD